MVAFWVAIACWIAFNVGAGVKVAVLVTVGDWVGVSGFAVPHEATEKDKMHKRPIAHLVFIFVSLSSYKLMPKG